MKKLCIIILVSLLVFLCSKKEDDQAESEEIQENAESQEQTTEKTTTVKKSAPAPKKVERNFANLIAHIKAGGFNEPGSKGEPNFKIYTEKNIMEKLQQEEEITQEIITGTSYFSTTYKAYIMIYEFNSASDANSAKSTIIARLLKIIPKMASPGGMTNADTSVLRIKGDYPDDYIKKLVVVNGEFMISYFGRYTAIDKLSSIFKKF